MRLITWGYSLENDTADQDNNWGGSPYYENVDSNNLN